MKRNTEAIFKDYKLWFAAAAAMHLLFAILLGRVGLMAFAFYNLFATMLYSVCSGLGEQYLHRLLRVTYIETCAFVLLGAAILEIRWQYSIALYLLFFLCFSTSLTAALMLGTKAKRYEQEWKDATVDELTGMYNSKYFLKKVDQVVKESTETYDLIYIDILNFSMFNKVFGDKKANEILMRLAERMRQMSEKEGICGRLFVDEFGILLPSRAYQESYLLDCIHEFQEKFSSSIYQMYMKVGVYRIKDANESSKEICVKAKLALDSIEGDYDKVLAYYDEKMLHDTIMKQKIIGEFNEALEDGQFCIYLQPQVTAEGKLLGAEALVRWQHPTEGMISPGLFIPVLEETSLITQLDCFVWEQAAKLLQEWKREGNDQIYISVNVSAMDFYFIDIYETMTQLVEKYEISPANLKIEITETVFMSDMKNQTKLLERLRAYGFEVELDDFGSGYSSLSMLKDIMVDVIKIDMGFLSKTAYEKRSWSILQSIMEMAQKLEIQTITEGVETKQQVNGLLDIGCRIFQGYYFEKPMQVEDFTKKYLAVSAF